MKNNELRNLLKTGLFENDATVYVRIEGGIYYPIKEVVREKDGTFTIICKDLQATSVTQTAFFDFKK